jgi:hypothetical protein
MPDFIELDGKFVNLDNVAYVSTIPGKLNEPDTV